MRLTPEQKEQLENLYQTFLHDEKILKMKEYSMHRGSNCYIHSFKVAKLAIKRALRHKNVNLEVILIASILHDYYLYDWREEREKKKKHARKHPYIAAEQAKRDFDISKKVQKIIKSHMWPLNLKEFPDTTEARIVSLADKSIASIEGTIPKAVKKANEKETYEYISKLFDK